MGGLTYICNPLVYLQSESRSSDSLAGLNTVGVRVLH
jgi:hypothetical protein